MRYGEQLTQVQRLQLPSGIRKRINCFACMGSNTLSVANVNGKLSWYCFRASCGVKGTHTGSLTANDIRRIMLKKEENVNTFTLPSYFTSPYSSEVAITYLKNNNCLYALQNNLTVIRYDPKEDRTVFLVQHKGDVVDAVGRAMKRGATPKWRRYGASGVPFVCGTSRVAVVVEDAASACAVAPVATGVALMGTNLVDQYIGNLKSYDRCIVALDPDARKLGLNMMHTLSAFVPTTLAMITDDLKYFNPSQIMEQLKLDIPSA